MHPERPALPAPRPGASERASPSRAASTRPGSTSRCCRCARVGRDRGLRRDLAADRADRLVAARRSCAPSSCSLSGWRCSPRLAGWLISRRLTRPVRALTAAAARIGARRPLDARAARARRGAGHPRRDHGGDAPPAAAPHLRAAPPPGRGRGHPHRHRRRGVQRRPRPPHPYLNPQAAALLGVAPEEAVGRFCGDVLQAVRPDGTRPCDEHCPILHARFRGGTRAPPSTCSSRTARVAPWSSPARRRPRTSQFQVHARRDRRRGGAPAARLRARQHLARVPHAALGPARLDRAAARASPAARRRRGGNGEAEALVLALERGTPAAHAAHRQPAGERAHRVRAATRSAAGRWRSTRWSRRRSS